MLFIRPGYKTSSHPQASPLTQFFFIFNCIHAHRSGGQFLVLSDAVSHHPDGLEVKHHCTQGWCHNQASYRQQAQKTGSLSMEPQSPCTCLLPDSASAEHCLCHGFLTHRSCGLLPTLCSLTFIQEGPALPSLLLMDRGGRGTWIKTLLWMPDASKVLFVLRALPEASYSMSICASSIMCSGVCCDVKFPIATACCTWIHTTK